MEKAVEDLSELLEMPIEPDTIGTLRQKMTDKTVSYVMFDICVVKCHMLTAATHTCSTASQVYVSKRNEIVLDDTAKGFAEGRWEWNAPVPTA